MQPQASTPDPRYAHVNLIAAVGVRGQIGMKDGGIPWLAGTRGPSADLKWFKKMTANSNLIYGGRTEPEVRHLMQDDSRAWFPWYATVAPEALIESIGRGSKDGNIWIIGGGYTYRRFAPYVGGVVVLSSINYDSPPETDRQTVFFPFDAYNIKWS